MSPWFSIVTEGNAILCAVVALSQFLNVQYPGGLNFHQQFQAFSFYIPKPHASTQAPKGMLVFMVVVRTPQWRANLLRSDCSRMPFWRIEFHVLQTVKREATNDMRVQCSAEKLGLHASHITLYYTLLCLSILYYTLPYYIILHCSIPQTWNDSQRQALNPDSPCSSTY